MKKTNKKLKLDAQTLTGDLLKHVAGGKIPATKHSFCVTACTDC